MDLEHLLGDTLDLVNEHKEHARLARYHAQRSIEVAVEAGALLIEAKARLPHGEWGSWLERLGLPARTATRWMQIARLSSGHMADMTVFVNLVHELGGQARVASHASDPDYQAAFADFLDIRIEALDGLAASAAEIQAGIERLSPEARKVFLADPEYQDWKRAYNSLVG